MPGNMQKFPERLNHGNHNEEVCDYLEVKKDKFADWIITTAFYSALQFVSYRIFPFEAPRTEGKKTLINTIDEYCNYKETITGNKPKKHALLADLVFEKCSDISPDYDWLLSMSMNARYTEYQHVPEVGNKSRMLMKKIKAFCTRKEPNYLK